MNSETKSLVRYLAKEANLDIDRVVEHAFSGVIDFPGLPDSVSDTINLRLRMMLSGQPLASIDPLLRQASSEDGHSQNQLPISAEIAFFIYRLLYPDTFGYC